MHPVAHSASTSYSLPNSIAADVALVGELLQFPRLRPKMLTVDAAHVDAPVEEPDAGRGGDWPNACDAPKCKGLVTPAVLAERYKINGFDNAKGDAMSSMAVAEFQGQHFKPTDISEFGQSCHVNATVDTIVGGNTPATAGVEAELDIEYIKGVAQGVPLTVVYVPGRYSLLSWCTTVTGLADPPLVHSVSYGNDEKQQSGNAYMYSVNTAFMKAGARGLSILFAAGDQGVCGREGCGLFFKRFKPDFPGGE